MGIQARSLSQGRVQFALFVLFLFVAGITAGIWVSLRYFNDEIAEQKIPTSPMPGRMDRIIVVPAWIDHPFSREENPFLFDLRYHASRFDLNRFVFGVAHAALPPEMASRANDLGTLRATGLMNADRERVYHEGRVGETEAFFGHLGRIQSERAFSQIQEGLADERRRIDEDTLRALRVPGMVLYLAASAASGRPVRARIGTGTTVRTRALSKEDYQLRIDHRISAIGLFVGSSYDSIDQRRSLSLVQTLGPRWAFGVDRTISNVATDTQSALHVQFSTPF